MSDFDFDAIVVGSGFGGSVMTLRLAEKGLRVCLLERGRRYGMHDFPRRIHEIKSRLFWDPEDRQYGIMEFRDYAESDLLSVTASGLGGGSLIYANVLMRMPPEFFEGWPGGLSREKLEPYYDRVIATMEASPYPFESDPYYRATPKSAALRELCGKLEMEEDFSGRPEFIWPDLAVNFRGGFPGEQSRNRHGAVQSRCTKCGECDLGCNIHAKNTLDLNYIFSAEHNAAVKAEVRTSALVEKAVPLSGGGYRVDFVDPEGGPVQSLTAARVVLAAGSLGSTKLLLKMKAAGIMPGLSDQLGQHWCGNGDLEGTVLGCGQDIDPTKGPVITGAIRYRFSDYPDGFKHGAFIQDAGFPAGLAWFLAGKLPSPRSLPQTLKVGWIFLRGIAIRLLRLKTKTEINLGDEFARVIDGDQFVRKGFLLLGMGRDRNNGRIELRADGEPVIKWRMAASRLHYDRVRREMKKIARHLGGTFFDNPLTHIDKIIAVHPIGGCVMADAPEQGVVNPQGEVFGYPGLYVADASIIPTSLGPNPSLTIAALAEYIAERVSV
jgi:cholesterol oxidase